MNASYDAKQSPPLVYFWSVWVFILTFATAYTGSFFSSSFTLVAYVVALSWLCSYSTPLFRIYTKIIKSLAYPLFKRIPSEHCWVCLFYSRLFLRSLFYSINWLFIWLLLTWILFITRVLRQNSIGLGFRSEIFVETESALRGFSSGSRWRPHIDKFARFY